VVALTTVAGTADEREIDPADGGAIGRAVQILDALAAASGGLDVATIAAAVGMSPSGAHRSLRALVHAGLVTQSGRRRAYRLGIKVLLLARAMRSEEALVAASEPELRPLSALTGETVGVGVVRDDRMWIVTSVDGSGDLVARPTLGGSPHFHATGRGKLFLAHMPERRARALIRSTGLPRLCPNTIADEETLWRAVEEARARDYATSREERTPGVGGVAVPIRDVDRRVVATLGVTVPMFRFDATREAELLQHTRAAAARIERTLHGQPDG